jgi:hypothetical protein
MPLNMSSSGYLGGPNHLKWQVDTKVSQSVLRILETLL